MTLAERFARLGASGRTPNQFASLPTADQKPTPKRSTTVYSVAEAVRLQERNNAKLGGSAHRDKLGAREA